MITFAALQQNLYDWVKRYGPTGVRVIWEQQGEGRVQRPYVSLNLINPLVSIGEDELRYDPETDSTLICGTRELTLSINAYGAEAFDTLAQLQTAISWPSTQLWLSEKGIAIPQVREIRNLTQLQETRWETRAQMDLTIRVAANSSDPDIGRIESIEVTNGLDGSVRIVDQAGAHVAPETE